MTTKHIKHWAIGGTSTTELVDWLVLNKLAPTLALAIRDELRDNVAPAMSTVEETVSGGIFRYVSKVEPDIAMAVEWQDRGSFPSGQAAEVIKLTPHKSNRSVSFEVKVV